MWVRPERRRSAGSRQGSAMALSWWAHSGKIPHNATAAHRVPAGGVDPEGGAFMADPCVVGLDVGGSHSRAVLAAAGGRVLGTGRAGGGDPTGLGAGPASADIAAALEAAPRDGAGERGRGRVG